MTSATVALRQYRGRRTIMFCLSVIGLLTLLSLLIPLVSPHEIETINFEQSNRAPTLENWHWFGTDDLGRDQLVRTASGIRITLLVALVGSLVSLVIGVLYGATAGYIGGNIGAIMMRIVDAMYALPFMFFVILLMVVFERSLILIFVAIGAINWLDTARIVRGQTLSLKQRPFIDAARLSGVSTAGIILRHIAPNLYAVVIVYVTLTIPQVILFESFLSFLGLGVQEPNASLGSLISDGVNRMDATPWMLLIPSVVLATLLFCFNFLGDGLRDLLDPKSRTQ